MSSHKCKPEHEAEMINMRQGKVFTASGKTFKIDTMIDEDGNVTKKWRRATAIVWQGHLNLWYVTYLEGYTAKRTIN